MNNAQDRLTDLQSQIAQCTRCVAAGHLVVANPIAGARGRATDRIMLIGQAPGRLSVERNLPFGGPGGKVLDQWLTRAGFPPNFLRTGVYLSALTRCYPGKNPKGKGDRAPSPAEMALCRPWLDAEMDLVNPDVVLLVGGMAIRAFLGAGALEAFVGRLIVQDGRLWLPLPHPSGVSRWLNTPANQKLVDQALALLSDWREKHVHSKESASSARVSRLQAETCK
jgi:uracil-DNA glycosylase family 4